MDINSKTTSLGLREVTIYSIPENGRTFNFLSSHMLGYVIV